MLNPKQEKFVAEYLVDLNATQAAIRSGYAAGSAQVTGSRLLSHAIVSQAIAARQGRAMKKLDISVERILLERARLAFFDPRKLLDNTGRPLALQDLDDDTAAAIAGLKVSDKYETPPDGGERIQSTVLEYKLADKNASLTALEKVNGMYSSGDEPAGVFNIHVHF
ncbi:Terminase small subunit [uncultured Caudovirales phage]|uniref:Terminase small subunit n=1 Tax=uncultured Caudovirales phage TaxID=2100421 RepID=A0A6J5S1X3_9CAUD|nr:Terminase small subunit [uncultured Caudovirales phage]